MFLKRIIDKYKNLSLPVKAAFWYTICNFFNKGIALLTTPIFTRILTEEQYGTFAIFQSWFNILVIFTSLNIFMGGYTKGLLLYKDDADGFTSSQLSLTSIITLIFFSIYLLNVNFWTKIFELSPVLMFAMFVELLTIPALDFWMSRHRFDYKYHKVVIITMLMNVLSIVISVVAIVNTEYKLEARVFGDVFTKFMFSLPLFIFIFIKGKKFFCKEYWKYALKFNLPLIPHYLANYILGQSDRLMIGKMVGKEQAAYYSVAYTISTVVNLFIIAVNNALTPYIYKTIANKNAEKIKKTITPIVLVVAFLAIVIMAFAPEVILVFAGKQYVDAIYVIPPVAASTYFYFAYLLFSTIEYYYEKTGFIAIATTICALLNIVLNYFGIRVFGYYAAGYTTLICYILLTIFHYIFYKQIVKKELPNLKSVFDEKLIFLIGVIVVILMLLMAMTYKWLIIRYIFVCIIIIYAIIKRKYLMSIINVFKNKK